MEDTSAGPRQLASIDYFGKRAGRYRESHGNLEALEQLVRMAAPRGDEAVLDVGTGPGHLACAFAPHVRHVVASDVTMLMLREIPIVMGDRDVANLWRVAADAQALPFVDEQFDIVTSRLAAAHFPDHPLAVREMARVCKTGGMVLVADSMGPEDPDARAYVDELEWLRDSSHGSNHSFTEWNDAYRAAGLEVNEVYVTSGRMSSMKNWMDRADTPPENRARIYDLIKDAPESLKRHVDIGRDGDGKLFFTTSQIRILGRKR
jgi:SAM-dependent methyltransferase